MAVAIPRERTMPAVPPTWALLLPQHYEQQLLLLTTPGSITSSLTAWPVVLGVGRLSLMPKRTLATDMQKVGGRVLASPTLRRRTGTD